MPTPPSRRLRDAITIPLGPPADGNLRRIRIAALRAGQPPATFCKAAIDQAIRQLGEPPLRIRPPGRAPRSSTPVGEAVNWAEEPIE